MKKDELIKMAKEELNISLNPKDKLSILEEQVKTMKQSKKVEKKEIKKTRPKNPIASKSEYGRIVRWNPVHREEYWTFIWDEAALSKEEKEKLGL